MGRRRKENRARRNGARKNLRVITESSPVVRVTLILDDGTILTREWTMTTVTDDIMAKLKDPPPWTIERSKKWDHPQDPITFRAKVTAGHEDDAREWLFPKAAVDG